LTAKSETPLDSGSDFGGRRGDDHEEDVCVADLERFIAERSHPAA
jgi:hypothetical protein